MNRLAAVESTLNRLAYAESIPSRLNNEYASFELRLEEFEAIIDTGDDAHIQLRSQRTSLIRQLHQSVTEHIRVLNKYFNTASALQERVDAYQLLLQQRLFWLPSAPIVSPVSGRAPGKPVQCPKKPL